MKQTLWHFTCAHGRKQIGKEGTLKPNLHPLLLNFGPLVWLTSDPSPTREDVGLTSETLPCDRMAYRYRVITDQAEPWAEFKKRCPPRQVYMLEAGRDSSTWWVSRRPIKAQLAPSSA